MSYTAYVLPYENKVINLQEIVNEWTVIIASYHLFCFTEWVYDEDRRIEIGWSLLCVIGLNVTFNSVLLMVCAVKGCYQKIKKRMIIARYQKMTP